ncbi:hypothetical protein [Gordonia sp. IITR100]|uniref:hypothetical protein n=1 Tax=Gordonia sp. IITR100 TaxID=1314686 RepID=UPI001595E3AD|nr:hypothetical protein [Gordonia sp. IITR100]
MERPERDWVHRRWLRWMPASSYSIAVASGTIDEVVSSGSVATTGDVQRYAVDDVGTELGRVLHNDVEGPNDVGVVAMVTAHNGGTILTDVHGLCAVGSFLLQLPSENVASIYLPPRNMTARVQWFKHGQLTGTVHQGVTYVGDGLQPDSGDERSAQLVDAIQRSTREQFIYPALALAAHLTGIELAEKDFGSASMALVSCRTPLARV